jgi:putative ABC transport system permease protein
VGRSLALAAAGLAIGLPAAAAATRLLDALLYDTGRWDPATFAAVGAGLLLVAGVAAWLPARRAARVDPAIALRSE